MILKKIDTELALMPAELDDGPEPATASTGDSQRKTQALFSVVAVLTLLSAGCGGDDDDATAGTITTTKAAQTTTAPADTTTTTEAAQTTTAPADTTATTEAEGVNPGDTVEGDVELGQFPTPISFTTEDGWFVPIAEPDGVVLEDPVQEAPFTRAVLFLTATPMGGLDTIGDLVGSGDQYDEVTIVDEAESQVGGFDTTVYDLTYDGSGELPFLSTQGFGGRIILRNTEYYRIWEVDNGDDFVLFAPVLRGDAEWFDKAEALIDTIQFGEKSSELIGAWEATDSNVTWAVTEDVIATTAAGGIETAYTATDTTLEMGEESGANACLSGQIGVYEWEIEDDVLTMTLVSDQCSGRKNALDGLSLQRSE